MFTFDLFGGSLGTCIFGNSSLAANNTLPRLPSTHLKVQPCKLYNNKYMIASTHITNTEIFAFIAVLVFKLLSRKVLFINKKRP